MTRENFALTVQALASRRPFHPFTIELTGGRRLEVDHPMSLAYLGRTALFLAPGNVPVIFDHEAVAAVLADTAEASI